MIHICWSLGDRTFRTELLQQMAERMGLITEVKHNRKLLKNTPTGSWPRNCAAGNGTAFNCSDGARVTKKNSKSRPGSGGKRP